MKKVIGLTLLILGVLIVAGVLYGESPYAKITRVFSPYTLLTASWEFYKKTFINQDGRVVDTSEQNITTSEGQSYALLRSVWIDDKETFDFVWQWTQKNMQRSDGLFGWRWGQRSNKTYGFLPNGGENPASDADSDIALSLILASHRWHNPLYLQQAQKIINSLWDEETATASGKRYLIAGNWAQNSTTLIINPSYFAPYAWRLFAKVDTHHDWQSLITPAYILLEKSGKEKLDRSNAVGLPPDWVSIDRKTGKLAAVSNPTFTTNYSYDSLRIPWRIALDYTWNKSPQALHYLQTAFLFLAKEYQTQGKLAATYAHDGSVIDANEIPAMYATALAAFAITNPRLTQQVYQEKVIRLYSNDNNTFNTSLGYYDLNWLWFGASLYNKFLTYY